MTCTGVPELMKQMKSHGIDLHDWLVIAQGCRVGIDTIAWLLVFVAVFYSEVNETEPWNQLDTSANACR